MDNYFAYYFSVASIFVAALQFLNKNNWIHFAYLLFGCGAVALFMSSSILEKHTEFAASIVLLFVIGFALGSLKKGKEIYKQMVLTALCTLPLLISWSKTISIQDYTMNISAIHLGLIIFGSLIYYLSSLKYAVFTFVFKQTDPQLSHFTFQIILAGLGVYIGSFFASYFGVFLVGSGATVSAFLYKDYRISILLMGYFLFGSFITLNHIETLDFSLGKMFFGFILGVFFILLPNALNSVEQKRVLKFILPILLQIMLSILLIWLGTQKTDLGGFDAYLAVLFGIVATQLFVGTVNVNLLVLVLFLSIGLKLA